MHDREEHLFDQAFTDRAWSEMEMLLDREMPVQSRSRQLIWLWALGLVILGGAGWLFGPASNVIRVDDRTSLPLVDQTIETVKDPSELDASVAVLPNTTPEEKTKQAASAQSTEPDKIIPENTSRENPVPVISSIKGETPLQSAVSKNSISESQIAKSSDQKEAAWISSHEQQSSAEDQVESDNFLIMKEHERNSYAVAALSFLETGFKELSWPLRKTPESIEFKSKVRPKTSKWNWGVQASVLSTEFSSMNGGSLGVWGQRPHFFTPRLSLRMGLQYEQIYLSPSAVSVPANTRLDANSENSDPTTSFPPNRQVDTLTAQEAANQLQLKVRQFQLPLSLRWRMGQKWTAFGGAQLSYRNVFTREPATDDQQVSFAGSDPQEGLYSSLVKLDPGSTFPTDKLNRWDVGAHLGIGYRLNSRLEAMMSYEHGFQNLFQGLDLEAFDRKWRLGVSYRFK